MQELEQRILDEGEVVNSGLLKVDGFINHQVDPQLMMPCGQEFAAAFADATPDIVLTVESSGISPAFATAFHLGVPMIYARNRMPATMAADAYTAETVSHTKGNAVTLHVARTRILPGQRVLIIDDFLGSGRTVLALVELVRAAGAEVVGVGILIEKTFENGRSDLADVGVPLVSLAQVSSLTGNKIQLAT